MADIILGVLAILAGAFMLFAGQFVLRIALPIWGFFVGFAFGAGIVASWADESFLGTVTGWILGLVFALIFAIFAYLYYAVAVVLAFGAFGFAIGSGLIVAFGIDWNWLAVLVGIAIGLVFGLIAVFGSMPMLVLIFLSSVAGAVGVVSGLMLLVGSLNSSDFTRGAFTDAVEDNWFWYLLVVLLAVFGMVAQGQEAISDAPHRPAGLVRRERLTRAPAGALRRLRAAPSAGACHGQAAGGRIAGMDLQLKDRVYIVTGGARGLGRATADVLVADGAKVVISGRNADSLAEASAALGDAAVTVEADNADPATPARLIEAAREAFGRLDGVLISVGGPPTGTVSGTSDEDWSRSFDSVFLGAVRIARDVCAELEPGGSVAFVLSSSVRSPLPGLAISNGLRPGWQGSPRPWPTSRAREGSASTG